MPGMAPPMGGPPAAPMKLKAVVPADKSGGTSPPQHFSSDHEEVCSPVHGLRSVVLRHHGARELRLLVVAHGRGLRRDGAAGAGAVRVVSSENDTLLPLRELGRKTF